MTAAEWVRADATGHRLRREDRVRLLAPDDVTLPDLDALVPGVHACRLAEAEYRTTYYDSEELTLTRAGITLRHRSGGTEPSWSLKVPSDPEQRGGARRALAFAGTGRSVPHEARELLRAHLRGRSLTCVARVRTVRQGFHLLDAEGECHVHIYDDTVSRAPDGNGPLFREIEVEIADPGRLSRKIGRSAVGALRDQGCRAAAPHPKAMRVVGRPGRAQPELSIPTLTADATAATLAGAALATAAYRIVHADLGVQLGEPAARREAWSAASTLRQQLRQLSRAFDPDASAALDADLAWLTGLLTPVVELERDYERLQDICAVGIDPRNSHETRPMLARLDLVNTRACKTLNDGLATRRYVSLLATITRPSGTLVNDHARTASAKRWTRRAARKEWKRLDHAMSGLGDGASERAVARAQDRAVGCTIVADTAGQWGGRPARRFAAATGALRDALAERDDAARMLIWLDSDDRRRDSLVSGQARSAERTACVYLDRHIKELWRTLAEEHKLRRWFV